MSDISEHQHQQDDGVEEAADGEASIDRIDELQAEVDVLKDKLLRAVADAENVRRRAEQEKREAAQYGVVALAKDLIDVADNLERALDAAPNDMSGSAASLLDGVQMISKTLATTLERHGVERIEPLGQKFDPNRHQAIAEAASVDHAAGAICHVAQAGYVIGNRVIRAASVVVSKGAGDDGAHVDVTA